MKKNQLRLIIRQIVREEVQMALKKELTEVFKSLKSKPITERKKVVKKRKPMKKEFIINTDESDELDIDDCDVKIVWRIRERQDKRYVSIYFLNKKERKKQDVPVESDECIFQPEIILKTPDSSKALEKGSIFLPMANFEESSFEKETEDEQFDLLFEKKCIKLLAGCLPICWDFVDQIAAPIARMKRLTKNSP